jgi:CDP-diacylglycerol--serine O-phosphatidyltransferase
MQPRYSPADLMTIANGVCGFLALAVLAGLWLEPGAGGAALDHDTLITCLLLYGIGMVFDVLDGPVARWRGSSGLGPMLDTICDTISFGILPALLLVASVQDSENWREPALFAAALYVGATILRLARHAKDEAEDQAAAERLGESPVRGAFSGMPSPVGGNCVLALVVLAPPGPVAALGVAVVALLLVADYPYPNNSAYGGVFVAALLVASFAAIAGLISLDIPAVAALVGLLPVAIVRLAARWLRSLRHLRPRGRAAPITLGPDAHR